jgi:hypothetical protein
MKPIIIFSLIAFILISCNEPIHLDLDQTTSKIVIKGMVTNKPGYQSVKISRSVDFYANGQMPRVTNAVVTVRDDLGETINFAHNPNSHADSAGIYIPVPPFTGQIGRTYTLTVNVEGQIYEATDELLSVVSMDSVTYQVNEDEEEDPNEEGKIYELLMYMREPQDQNNFYLFKFYRNDTLVYYDDNEIYYTDDELLAENIDGVPSPVYYGINDTSAIEIYSLSRLGYVYYNDLTTVLNNDGGGMFGPIPASPRTNLSNGALGIFQVSAVNSIGIKIE